MAMAPCGACLFYIDRAHWIQVMSFLLRGIHVHAQITIPQNLKKSTCNILNLEYAYLVSTFNYAITIYLAERFELFACFACLLGLFWEGSVLHHYIHTVTYDNDRNEL